MEYLLNSSQMKRCDADTIRRIGVPSPVLMERAALAVVSELRQFSCDLSSVLVLCGSGNNGGDGFAVARLLQEQGIAVTAVLVGREESMTEETALQKKICENCGIKISSNFRAAEYTTIVDALFGIGLSRNVEGRYAETIRWINEQKSTVVAVDLPSGISADTGAVMGCAVRADLTVTFAFRKLGQILYPGAEYCGRVVCRPVGIGMAPQVETEHPAVLYTDRDLKALPKRTAYSNKGTYGRVLMIAGSDGMSGAAYLSALAAYRTGCGLVRIFTPQCNRQVLQTSLPEAIVTTWEEDASRAKERWSEEKLAQALAWADVVGIGPGLGTGEAQMQMLRYVLEQWEGPLVIDADGLNLLSGEQRQCGMEKAVRPALLTQTKAQVIITPHIGEMVRLTGLTKNQILSDLIGTAKRFADTHHVICVLKDARTIVSDGTEVMINTSGNDGMAVGGSGDVLTGVLCSLIAQGMEPFAAARSGVYLHGRAGDAARERCGAYGMLARDVADGVGEVLRNCGEPCKV